MTILDRAQRMVVGQKRGKKAKMKGRWDDRERDWDDERSHRRVGGYRDKSSKERLESEIYSEEFFNELAAKNRKYRINKEHKEYLKRRGLKVSDPYLDEYDRLKRKGFSLLARDAATEEAISRSILEDISAHRDIDLNKIKSIAKNTKVPRMYPE